MHGGHVFTFQFGLLIVTFEPSRPPCWHAHKTHPTHTPVPPNPAVEPPSAERRRGPASAFRYTQCWSLNSVMELLHRHIRYALQTTIPMRYRVRDV